MRLDKISANFTLAALLFYSAAAPAQPGDATQQLLQIDRRWEVLKAPTDEASYRDALRQAATALAGRPIVLAGVQLDEKTLAALADSPPQEPLLRAVREQLRLPVDLDDFMLFLDDLLSEENSSFKTQLVWMPSGRARAAGILIHPQEVFKNNAPRRYADGYDTLNVDKPAQQADLAPAVDGEPLGPRWTRRFVNPSSRASMLAALDQQQRSHTYAARIRSLLAQFEAQGATVYLDSTLRNRTRGYLMWGAFILNRATAAAEVAEILATLEKLNKQWGLNAPIQWRHPDGWQATVEAARQMTDTYGVVYATKNGARSSNHYDGIAVDMTVIGLGREVTLKAPDGSERRFDLSATEQTRDLSLTPELISWIEQHFQMRKLKMDYPHWDDVAPPSQSSKRPK